MTLRPISTITLIIGCAMLFYSCQSLTKKKTPVQEISLYLEAEPLSLDPRVGGDASSQLVARELFEGLTRFGKGNVTELALAESVTVSDDKTQYTFRLRPSLWSNDQPVTSHDFEYAWKSIIFSPLGSMFPYAFYVIKNAQKASRGECSLDQVGISCPDDRTLQVTLEHPAPYFLEWTSNPIYSPVCKTVVENNSNWSKSRFPEYVCNGPFVLKEHTINSSLVLEKNKNYWNPERVKSDRISLSILEDATTAYNLFEAGKLDWYGAPCCLAIPPELIKRLQEEGSLHSMHTGITVRMDCCVTKPYLASPKIRRAIAEAINRKELTTLLYCGGDLPAASIVPSYSTLLKTPLFKDGSPESARALFEQGIAELGYTRETYPELTIVADSRYKLLAEVLSQQIHSSLGIPVQTKIYERASLMKMLEAGEHELAIQGWVTWLQDPIYNLESFKYGKNKLTYTGWDSDQYKSLLDASDQTRDEHARKELLADAEALLMTELPTIPLFYLSRKYTRGTDVEGECYSSPIAIPELFALYHKEPQE